VKRQPVETHTERRLLTAMIVSDNFLAAATPILDAALFATPHAQQIVRWCVDYFQQYGGAPKRHIESLYLAWAAKQGEEDDHADALHGFLSELSDQYEDGEDQNVPFLLDELSTFLTLRKATALRDGLEWALLEGDVARIAESIEEFHQVGYETEAGFDLLGEEAPWQRAFAEPPDAMLSFPGEAGEFLGPALVRDSLIAIQGPEKRGKTWWCVEFVMRALRNRKKVAFFQVGDLSEGQLMKRMGVRLSGRPLWKTQCGRVAVPVGIERADTGDDEGAPPFAVEVRHKICRHPVSYAGSLRAVRRFLRGCGIPANRPYLMSSVHSNSSINVAGITTILQTWQRTRDFVPDVIVIDYADILAPEDARQVGRDRINETWMALRRLSQDYHALVLVPTQADAASYEQVTQSMRNFSEDKRKQAHCTGVLGLNQTPPEKQAQVMRLNWIVLRESPFLAHRCLYVGQCPTLGRAYCCGAVL